MQFPKFKEPTGSPKEYVEILGTKISKYRLGFLEANFGITEAKLRKMSEDEAKTWLYKARWIMSTLWSRIFESDPPLLVAEEEFGLNSFDEFIAMPPSKFLGKDGLYEKVEKRLKEMDY